MAAKPNKRGKTPKRKKRPAHKQRKNKNGLTPNQQIFADEWLKDRNGTRAYLAAYPAVKKDKTARSAAPRVLAYVSVKAYTDKRLEELSATSQIDQEWVLERFRRLTEYNINDLFDDEGNMRPLSEIPPETIYAICGLDVDTRTIGEDVTSFIQKFKLPNKLDVLKALAKHLGMFEKDNRQKNPLGDALERLLDRIAEQPQPDLKQPNE